MTVVLSRFGPTQMASRSASLMPGGRISVALAPSRRRPPKEYMRMAVAIRMAGRLMASVGNSLARRSSMRRARALAPTKSCSRHAWKSACWPTSLKKASRTAGSWSGTSPGPRTARLVPAAWQSGGRRRENAGRRGCVGNRDMAAQRSRMRSISAGWKG